MEQDHWMKALVQVKRMGNLLNEVLDLSQQMAESLDRNDQVAVEMLLAMRQEPIGKLEAVEQALREQVESVSDPEMAVRMDALLKGGPPEEPGEKMLADQVAANRRRLKQVIDLDKVINRKMARDKSIYS